MTHTPPNLIFPGEFHTLAALFGEAGALLHAVGGQVRNPLLGLPVSDRDVCSALPPDAVCALCKAHGLGYTTVGAAFGTVAIRMGDLVFEHTVFRADEYPPGGAHHPQRVAFGASLSEDAFRRDFTVNALYASPAGAVLDPTGRGLADLAARVIRATSPDPADILRSDALRILRMVRFACELGFAVDPATFAAAKENVAGLRDISPERIREELNKILLSDRRYGAGPDAVLRGLDMLNDLGALPIILPELAACRDVSQRAQYHAYDVLTHMLHTCAEYVPPQDDTALEGRLAALLHDTGKPEAKRRNAELPTEARGHMYGHDAIGAELARAALTRLRYPNDTVDAVCALIAHHMFDLTGTARESTLRERFAVWGYAHSLQLAALREADVRGSGRTLPTDPVPTADRFRRVLAQMQADGAPFSLKDLRCTGADVMAWTGLAPGPRVGETLHALLLHCARKPGDNTPQKLRRLCKDMAE